MAKTRTRKSRRSRRNEICPLCGLVNPLFAKPTKAQAEFRARLFKAYVEASARGNQTSKAIDELLRELIREKRIKVIRIN